MPTTVLVGLAFGLFVFDLAILIRSYNANIWASHSPVILKTSMPSCPQGWRLFYSTSTPVRAPGKDYSFCFPSELWQSYAIGRGPRALFLQISVKSHS